MNALVELMGSLSNVRFATVSDRFIAELEKYKTGAPVKDKEVELRMEMLIRGMRYLNLKVHAQYRWTIERLGFMKVKMSNKSFTLPPHYSCTRWIALTTLQISFRVVQDSSNWRVGSGSSMHMPSSLSSF